MQEIVGAIIDSDEVTSDMSVIVHSIASGRRVQYISRKQARAFSAQSGGQALATIAKAPTLFLIENGVKYMPPSGKT